MPMRILSLNVWGGRIQAPLLHYLKQVDADVLCLQEVLRAPSAKSDWLVYRDGDVELLQRAHLYEEICAVLPDHQAFFHPTARGDLFDGDRRVASEFGLATFVRHRYPVIGQAMAFVHGDFSADGWGAHPRSRNAHVVRLFNDGDRLPVTIAQMHGLRELGGKYDTPARQLQADSFVRLIRRVWQSGERLVVCGDLNLLPQSATFGTLATLGLSDLVTRHGHTDTRTSHYAKDNRFADYMLTTDDVDVIRFDVVSQPEVSDHRALLMDIR